MLGTKGSREHGSPSLVLIHGERQQDVEATTPTVATELLLLAGAGRRQNKDFRKPPGNFKKTAEKTRVLGPFLQKKNLAKIVSENLDRAQSSCHGILGPGGQAGAVIATLRG